MSKIEKRLDEILDMTCVSPDDQNEDFRNNLKQLLESINSDNDTEPIEKHYLRGYLGYHLGEHLENAIDVEKEFLAVLEIEPDQQGTLEYLGYCYFDTGQYDLSLEYLQKVDLKIYDTELHKWRERKLRELIICCRIRLGRSSKVLIELIELLDELAKFHVDSACPTEIVRTVSSCFSRIKQDIGDSSYDKIVCKLMKVIAALRLNDTFYAEELAMINQESRIDINKHEKINYVELPAKDIDEAKSFFSAVFGWSFVDYGPDYTAFENAGIDGGFYRSELNASTENGSALIVLFSFNLQTTQAKIEEAGGSIVKPIFSFPGGQRFHFTDPNGNEFAVWSDVN